MWSCSRAGFKGDSVAFSSDNVENKLKVERCSFWDGSFRERKVKVKEPSQKLKLVYGTELKNI